MRAGLRRGLGASLAVALFATTVSAQSPGAGSAPPATVARGEALRLADAWLEGQRAYFAVPGMSAAVVGRDGVVFAKGYGTIDAKGRIPATADTIYSTCSISKLFTSVAAMQLWEGGKLRLDEPISSYLSWARISQSAPDSLPITLGGLLSHSAGLPREAADRPYWSGPDYVFPTDEDIRGSASDTRTLFGASRYFQYSNLGLVLVGEAVAEVSGEPYAQYVAAHVLQPLGMNDTRLGFPAGERTAVGHSAPRRDGARDALPRFDTKGLAPAAGYTSTVGDMAKFAQWQLRLLADQPAGVLKSSSLREMHRPRFVDPTAEVGYGLGFAVQTEGGEPYVGHGGECPGFRSFLRLHPKTGTAVVVMQNSNDDPRPFVRGIFAILARRAASTTPWTPPPGVKLEDYAGRYDPQPWASEIIVSPWAGGLAVLSLPAADPVRAMAFLKPVGGDVFRRIRADGSEAEAVRFLRNRQGRVTGLRQHSNTWPRT